jgi:hypothetical protein
MALANPFEPTTKGGWRAWTMRAWRGDCWKDDLGRTQRTRILKFSALVAGSLMGMSCGEGDGKLSSRRSAPGVSDEGWKD